MLSRALGGGLPRLNTTSRCEPPLAFRPLRPILFTLSRYNEVGVGSLTLPLRLQAVRQASSSSATRWKSRQSSDKFAKEAKVAGLKSRAAFKLLEIDSKHRIFRPGDTVVDLGYAPGSWSQVAIAKTQPNGRVVGIDVIPAQPPKGVSTIQGDFLSDEIREEVRRFVQVPERGRARPRKVIGNAWNGEEDALTEDELDEENRGLLELEKASRAHDAQMADPTSREKTSTTSQKELDQLEGRVVNVVLSDMSEPWPQTSSMWIKSVSNPYRRMMNTSGMPFRDHAGSMVSKASTTTHNHRISKR